MQVIRKGLCSFALIFSLGNAGAAPPLPRLFPQDLPTFRSIAGNQVTAIWSKASLLLVGTSQGLSVSRDGGESFETLSFKNGFRDIAIRQIEVDSRQNIYVLTQYGLYHTRDLAVMRPLLTDGFVRFMRINPSTDELFAFSQRSLNTGDVFQVYVTPGPEQQFTELPSLLGKPIRDFRFDSRGTFYLLNDSGDDPAKLLEVSFDRGQTFTSPTGDAALLEKWKANPHSPWTRLWVSADGQRIYLGRKEADQDAIAYSVNAGGRFDFRKGYGDRAELMDLHFVGEDLVALENFVWGGLGSQSIRLCRGILPDARTCYVAEAKESRFFYPRDGGSYALDLTGKGMVLVDLPSRRVVKEWKSRMPLPRADFLKFGSDGFFFAQSHREERPWAEFAVGDGSVPAISFGTAELPKGKFKQSIVAPDGARYLVFSDRAFISRDGGSSYAPLFEESSVRYDSIAAMGAKVIVTGSFGIRVSDDQGRTFVASDLSRIDYPKMDCGSYGVLLIARDGGHVFYPCNGVALESDDGGKSFSVFRRYGIATQFGSWFGLDRVGNIFLWANDEVYLSRDGGTYFKQMNFRVGLSHRGEIVSGRDSGVFYVKEPLSNEIHRADVFAGTIRQIEVPRLGSQYWLQSFDLKDGQFWLGTEFGVATLPAAGEMP